MQGSGVIRRLQRIAQSEAVHLVALDHGVTMGWTEEQSSPKLIASDCFSAGIKTAVCHVGLVQELSSIIGLELILQLFGSTSGDSQKAKIAEVRTAVELDCVAIAVELHIDRSSSQQAESALAVAAAHRYGLPSLVMANYDGDDWRKTGLAIVAGHQIGADLIKIRLPTQDPSDGDREFVSRIVAMNGPCLVAGGDGETDLQRTTSLAHSLGMSGSCIGRHYFDSGRRLRAIETTLSAFQSADGGAA